MKLKLNGGYFEFIAINFAFGVLHCLGIFTLGISLAVTGPWHFLWLARYLVGNIEIIKE